MLFNIVRNALIGIGEPLGRAVVTARLQKKYPTCHFHPGATVTSSSSLGKYNVIFKNVSVVDSTIGDHTFIQKESVVNNADVGKFCSIAMYVNIGLTQHAISYVSTHPAFYLLNTPLAKIFSKQDMFQTTKQTIVGHDVWIGQGSMIIGGAVIGTGSVIGAGSVVTKAIPPYAVAAGAPARVIRYRFEERVIEGLMESQWWNMSDDEIREKLHLFVNPNSLIESLERG